MTRCMKNTGNFASFWRKSNSRSSRISIQIEPRLPSILTALNFKFCFIMLLNMFYFIAKSI